MTRRPIFMDPLVPPGLRPLGERGGDHGAGESRKVFDSTLVGDILHSQEVDVLLRQVERVSGHGILPCVLRSTGSRTLNRPSCAARLPAMRSYRSASGCGSAGRYESVQHWHSGQSRRPSGGSFSYIRRSANSANPLASVKCSIQARTTLSRQSMAISGVCPTPTHHGKNGRRARNSPVCSSRRITALPHPRLAIPLLLSAAPGEGGTQDAHRARHIIHEIAGATLCIDQGRDCRVSRLPEPRVLCLLVLGQRLLISSKRLDTFLLK